MENLIYKIILTIIIIIYTSIGIYLKRKIIKYRQINKILLRDSIIAGLTFGVAAYIFIIYIGFDRVYIPIITSFLTGSFFWYSIFWNRNMTVLNGIYVGTLSIFMSNVLFWYIYMTYLMLFMSDTLGFSDTILETMKIIILPPIFAITMTFFSLIFAFNIVFPTIIIGGFTGGLVAYIYQKRHSGKL